MEFLFGLGSLFLPFGLLLLGLIVLAVVALFGRRASPDPTGRRPMAIYLLAVMFITLFVTAGAVAQIGGTLAETVNEEPGILPPRVAPPLPGPVSTLEPVEIPPESDWAPLTAPHDRTLSQVLEAGFVGLLGLSIFEFHRRRWREILRKESGDG